MKKLSGENKNNTSVWHSEFGKGRLAKHPHELVIDLGSEREIAGFRYLARQDPNWNGSFGEAEFSISNSADEFPEPQVKKTFEKVKTAQAADCEKPVSGRYVRIRINSEVNGKEWASAADIGIIANPK